MPSQKTQKGNKGFLRELVEKPKASSSQSSNTFDWHKPVVKPTSTTDSTTRRLREHKAVRQAPVDSRLDVQYGEYLKARRGQK